MSSIAQKCQVMQPVTFHDPATIKQIKTDVRNGDHEDRVPQEATVEEAAICKVINAQKESIPFSSLYERKGDSKRQRHLFIFVRHFFCGLCQDYIRELTRLLPPSSLPTNTQISIIGCGSEDLIPTYAEATECPYPLYADPTKRLYDTFMMGRNLSMGNRKPDYQTRSHINLVVDSLVQSLRSGLKIFSGGAYSQLGGEMLFEDGEVVWCHRMRNTRDHTEVPILKKILEMS